MISAWASGDPQPIPPDSSFRFQIRRRIIIRASSRLDLAIVGTTMPKQEIPRDLISKDLEYKVEKSGEINFLGKSALSESVLIFFSQSASCRIKCSCFFIWR